MKIRYTVLALIALLGLWFLLSLSDRRIPMMGFHHSTAAMSSESKVMALQRSHGAGGLRPIHPSQVPLQVETALGSHFDAVQYASDPVYRGVMAERVRLKDFEQNPIYKTAGGKRLVELLEDRGITGHQARIVLRLAVHDLVLDRDLALHEQRSFEEMRRKIGKNSPDFKSGSIEEVYYSDQVERRKACRDAAILSLSEVSGIVDPDFYEELFRLDLGGSIPPLLTHPAETFRISD